MKNSYLFHYGKSNLFIYIFAVSFLLLNIKSISAQEQPAAKPETAESQESKREERKKNVKWVNPDIKAFEGLSHHVLQSKALGHEVGYAVWLPAKYAQKTKKHYPVIYFLHGMGGSESADAPSFSRIVSKAIEEGILPPVICVFPNGGVSFYRDEVEKMIIDEIIPTIDTNYRTIAKGKSRALAGFSMGGFGSVYLSVQYPDMFCAAGSMGGGLWRMGEEFKQATEKAIPVWKKNNNGFFFVNGDKDRPEAFKEFAENLTEKEIENQLVVIPDLDHNLGLYYERSADQMLKLLAKHLKTK